MNELELRGCLESANARIAELEEQVASWREAHERAAIIAAEECNRQKAELEARLKEAEGEMLLMHVELAAKRAFKAELETRATAAEADAARLRQLLKTVEALTINGDREAVQEIRAALRAEQLAGRERR